MKNTCFTFFFLICFALTAQNFNDYKYIIVPKTFSIFKTPDKYRTSALTKFLFKKKGYNVVYDDALPEDINNNRCSALKTELRNESNMFTTKTRIVLLDCNNKEVFISEQGKSKDKEFVKAYSEAIRSAFKSFENISYTYTPKEQVEQTVTLNVDDSVVKEMPKEETVTLSFKDDVKNIQEQKNEASDIKLKNTEVNKTISKANPIRIEKDASALYAQEIENGFQLVDSTPKIVYKIYKTSVEGYFIAEQENSNGVVVNKNGSWFFEYYENNQLKSIELKIKF